jgi:two-component system response regulator AtoC
MPLTHAVESLDIRDLPPIEVIFGRSSLMAAAREKLERVAATTVPVLLQGESGTGKDIFAKLLHLYSNRSKGAWVKVACPAIPHSLIESELFGYEKGAFTGAYATKRGRAELAHMGTLFLDEIGDLDLSVQAKLLQLLQDGSFTRVGGQESRTVNTRLVSAASRNLREQAEDGGFRLDFLFRINAVTIELPHLRQRTVDLPMLIDYFLDLYSKEFQRNPKPLSREVTRLMQRYEWPGNIRQLENMIRSYVLIGSEEVLATDLVESVRRRRNASFSSVCAFVVLAASARAQFDTATVLGTVTDPSGAVVPHCQVALHNTATDAQFTATTDDRGEFRFVDVSVGPMS